MRKVIIMGAAGRDFHNFNVAYRDRDDVRVVAFTATQIPYIDDRTYPAALAGANHPDGIPIHPEADLEELIHELDVDEVVFSYSDVSHVDVMHKASQVLAAGASFTLLGPKETMLRAPMPVVSICAVRTGAGKSQTARAVSRVLNEAGLRTVAVRHPMPYGDLLAERVQRFDTLADLDAAHVTIEEREEYEPHIRAGSIVFAGVDYGDIMRAADGVCDVLIWDGGNNDFSFYRSDLQIVVVDPLRPGDELAYHPGEANLRMADVIVINKIDSASIEQLLEVERSIDRVNPRAQRITAASRLKVDRPDLLAGARALVIEDGPTLTHGGMTFGAGVVAARRNGVSEIVDPRPYAIGSLADVFVRFPVGDVLPAMGYAPEQILELEKSIEAVPCDVVVVATPIDLTHLLSISKPIVRVTYELDEVGAPTLADVLAPIIGRLRNGATR